MFGHTMTFPNNAASKWFWGSIYKRGVWDADSLQFAQMAVNEGEIILESGACYGDVAVQFAMIVGQYGKVYSFEPNPESQKYDIIQKKTNNKENIIKNFNVALGKEAKENLTFYNIGNNQGATHISTGGGKDLKSGRITGTFVINMTTVDKILANESKPVNFIKSDNEGYDCFMLQGAKNTILENKNIKGQMEWNFFDRKNAEHEKELRRECLNYFKSVDVKYFYLFKYDDNIFKGKYSADWLKNSFIPISEESLINYGIVNGKITFKYADVVWSRKDLLLEESW